MAPSRPPTDPLAQAEAFAIDAELARDDDWRATLVQAARHKLDDARAALDDGEEALAAQPSHIAALMRRRVARRRCEIAQVATQLDRLEALCSSTHP